MRYTIAIRTGKSQPPIPPADDFWPPFATRAAGEAFLAKVIDDLKVDFADWPDAEFEVVEAPPCR